MSTILERIIDLTDQLTAEERSELDRYLSATRVGVAVEDTRADELDALALSRDASIERGEQVAIPWVEAQKTIFQRPR